MAFRIRDATWQDDSQLKENMRNYLTQGLQRKEILNFMERDFRQYAWSLRSLDRRLRYFNLYRSDVAVTLNEVKTTVCCELEGPGKLLGYRAMHLKIRQQHRLNVPRDLVYATMTDVDLDGLQGRRLDANKRRKKGSFSSSGPNWVLSLDGHDKLMGYQNNTFPLAVYGCIDTASRKLLWIRAWVTNSPPELPARWYFDYLYESRTLSSFIRLDKGTETGIMATMHAFLRKQQTDIISDEEACETVIYGPSTSNQVRYIYF